MGHYLKYLVALLVIIPIAPAMTLADLYMWTDDQGIRHFSNISPPRTVNSAKISEQVLNIPNGFLCRVTKVFDGDTIRVAGKTLEFKVRLIGIDCPESKWKKMPEQPFSKEARQKLAHLILSKQVVLKQYGTGSYNRVLAEVFYHGKNVNLAMVRLGLAEVYQGKTPPSLDISEFRQAEKQARQKHIGIWSMGNTYVSPKKWRKQYQNK